MVEISSGTELITLRIQLLPDQTVICGLSVGTSGSSGKVELGDARFPFHFDRVANCYRILAGRIHSRGVDAAAFLIVCRFAHNGGI